MIEFHEDNSLRLYDLDTDPGEQKDLATQMPARTAQMKSDLARWRASVGAQMPTPNPNFDPTRATKVAKRKVK